jgi:hypothetical protein
MRRIVLLAVGVVAAMLWSSCVTPQAPYDPFLGKGTNFTSAAVRKIAVYPMLVGKESPTINRAKAEVESAVESTLRGAGLHVVPVSDMAPIQDELIKSLGGLFDPITGKPVEEKVTTLQKHRREEAAARFGADAIVLASFEAATAPVVNSMARWNGAMEIATRGSKMDSFFTGPVNGDVPALSLVIRVEDVSGNVLFANAGGIQVLAKAQANRWVPIPDMDVLADSERNTNAVALALEPLLAKLAGK